jgi:hypothetical protein
MTVHELPVAPPVPGVDEAVRRARHLTPGAHRTQASTKATDEGNPHKLVAQYRKARKVADALVKLGATTASIPELEGEQAEVYRRLAAEVAGTRVPSKESWALVLVLVEEGR